MIYLKWILCVWGIFTSLQLCAEQNYIFQHLSQDNGLSDNYAIDISKDKQGFLWFVTQEGVNRYDGFHFKQYKYTRNNFHLSANSVRSIQCDKTGLLWIDRYEWYFIYDREKDGFFHAENHLATLGIKDLWKLNFIKIDHQENLWVYNGKKFYYYDFSAKQLHDYSEFITDSIISVQCRDYQAYILYENGTVNVLDCQRHVISRSFYLDRDISLYYRKRCRTYLDENLNLWVYFNEGYGVWQYDSSNNRWNHFHKESPTHPISGNEVKCVMDDRQGNIWIATEYNGINVMNKRSRKITQLLHTQSPHSLSSDNISMLYLDDQQTMWVGLMKKGISFYNPNYPGIQSLQLPGKNNVTSFAEDADGNLWMGLDGGGLAKVDANGRAKVFTAQHYDIPSDVIVSIFLDSKKRLWLGSYLNGISVYENGRFTRLHNLDIGKTPSQQNSVWEIAEDKNGTIWFGNLYCGLISYNPETGQSKQYDPHNSALIDEHIMGMCCHKGTYIYMATCRGLSMMDVNTRRIENIHSNRKKTQLLADTMLTQVFVDSRNLVWIGGREGIAVFDRQMDSIYYLNKRNYLISNFIRGIREDDNKNIWVTTDRGITNLVVSYAPDRAVYNFRSFKYGEQDGLQNADCNAGAIYKTQNGRILAGGYDGYNIIYPDLIQHTNNQPKILFTTLRINNKEIEVDSSFNNSKILETNIGLTKHLELSYRENTFSLDFSCLEYLRPLKINYAYKLDDNDWITLSENKVTFTGMAPGNYLLQVRASNTDGIWSPNIAKMKITIYPPFWASCWAYLVYFVLFIGICARMAVALRHKQQEKMRIKEFENEALHQHESDEMRLRFFTNVSHDFRTPLSLIITPLEKILQDIKDEKLAENIRLIHRNASHLLELVNQLLDFRKLDVKAEHLNMAYGDFVAFIKETTEYFRTYTEKSGIELAIITQIPSLEINFDKDKIRKTMMNLLSNAFKYTNQEHGKVKVEVGVDSRQGKQRVWVSVADNGIGIKNEDKEKIFERFYQVVQPQLNYGSGIGLHIVKEYVNMHGGEIVLRDNHPSGCIFTFYIPVNQTEEVVKLPEVAVIPKKEDDTRRTLLVVEDNEDFRGFLVDCLKNDYTIYCAVHGEHAIKILQNYAVDVVISDIMMPVMNGLELCNYIKSHIECSHIPVILLTARTTDEHVLEGLKEGADDYLTKPFNLDILKLRIQKLLDWSQQSHEKFKKIKVNPSEITVSSIDEKFIEQAIKIVEENIDNTKFSVEELSTMVGMSRSHLYNKLVSITGKTPIEFIRVIRIKRAMQLLIQSKMSISEIAYRVGFNSPKIFAHYFKDEYGELPSEYKRNHRNEVN